MLNPISPSFGVLSRSKKKQNARKESRRCRKRRHPSTPEGHLKTGTLDNSQCGGKGGMELGRNMIYGQKRSRGTGTGRTHAASRERFREKRGKGEDGSQKKGERVPATSLKLRGWCKMGGGRGNSLTWTNGVSTALFFSKAYVGGRERVAGSRSQGRGWEGGDRHGLLGDRSWEDVYAGKKKVQSLQTLTKHKRRYITGGRVIKGRRATSSQRRPNPNEIAAGKGGYSTRKGNGRGKARTEGTTRSKTPTTRAELLQIGKKDQPETGHDRPGSSM